MLATATSCDLPTEFSSVGTPPPELGLDPFYAKYVDALGIPVVASAAVSDAALLHTRNLLIGMTAGKLDLHSELAERNVRVAVIGIHQVTTDIPEYSDLSVLYPEIDWDTRTRGVGATLERPVSTVGEENVLGCTGDPYRGESIFIHEFAHTLATLAIVATDDTFETRLIAAYDAAIAAGLWADTYAAENSEEYWAEGVQSWFDSNSQADPPDGIHNYVNTREELRAYDPTLAELIEEFFTEGAWRYSYPARPDAACTTSS